LTIGDKFKNLYEYESESRKSTQAVNDLQNRLERLSNANNTLNQQLIDAQAELTSIQDRLTSADVDTLPDDLQVISNQISALQTDIDNLNIPEYGLATQTEDGLMSSVDKIKLDGLESYDVATESVDGLMSSTDKTKLNGLESYSVATETEDGLMSAVDKISLDKVVDDLGDITTLTTTEKTDIVLAINELVTRLEVLEGGA
jgi:DNA repair exonuclease SbcCD ATPase subunit